MSTILVFLGPTLPRAQAEQLLNAIYLPPAAQSDLISALHKYQPDVIALIDGVFFNSPSVWHKEILYALKQGVAVYGASSMGALRAAETDNFGMIGFGRIYQQYADGELDDDEVALVYDSAEQGYRPLSEPMVNVRATFDHAHRQGILNNSELEQLIAISKSIYFAERTFQSIFYQAKSQGFNPELIVALQSFVKEHYVDLKRQDATLLLQTIQKQYCAVDQNSKSKRPPKIDNDNTYPDRFDLAQTHVFSTLYECERKVERQGVQIPLRRIAEFTALHTADFDDLNFNSLNRMLAQVLGAILGVEATESDIEKEIKRLRFKHQLKTEKEFNQWQQDNDLSSDDFYSLMNEIAICRRLHQWLLARQSYQRNIKGALNEMRLQNCYVEWADAAADQAKLLQENHFDLNTSSTRKIPLNDLLLDHLQTTQRRIPTSLQHWMMETGFLNTACLQVELIRSKATQEIEN